MQVYLVKLKRPQKEYQLTSYAYPPFELLSLGTVLKAHGIAAKCLHGSVDEAASAIGRDGTGDFMVLDVPFYELIKDALDLCRRLREARPGLRIILAGEFPSAYPEVCARSSLVDYAIRGDYEDAVLDILTANAMAQGIYAPSCSGSARGSGATETNLKRFTPCDWDLVDMTRYIYTTRSGSRVLPFLSSKGCNFFCHFCYLSRPENAGKWVGLDAESVIEQIRTLRAKADFNEIHFNDRNFMRHKDRAFTILHALRSMGITLHALDVRLDAIDEDFIRELCGLGVKGLFVGIESSHERLLKLMNKRITKAEIVEKISLLAGFPQLKVYGNVITCVPTQTEEEFRQDIRFALSLKHIHPHLSLSLQGFFPWPETPLGELAVQNGYRAPQTLDAWADHLVSEFFPHPTWLDWKTIDPDVIFWILRYRNIINFCREPNPGKNWILFLENVLGGLFFQVSSLRLEHLWFKWPLDMHLFNVLASVNFRMKKVLGMFS